jgi:spermidine/putrescine-binding protein
MKRFVLGLVLLLSLSACAEAETSKTLKVFNWGVYIDETLIDEFEAEYGVEVIYDTFDSNETMYTKLASGEVYDVLYPSDYMVDRLIEEGLVQKLESETKAVLESYLPFILGQDYDPENDYSIPYFWGNVGILYDTNIVDVADVSEGWNVFKNPKYAGQVYFYDSERDAFMVALKALGYSTNTEDDAELNKAYDWLVELNQSMNAIYVTDDVIDNMIAGNKALAIVYSGDAAYILDENEDMAYYVPEEGSNVWIDSMVIPSNAQNPDLANAWIRFMSTVDAMERNTLEVGYTTVRQDVYSDMIQGDYEGNSAYDVRMDNPNDEVYTYNKMLKQKLSDLWIKIKAQ